MSNYKLDQIITVDSIKYTVQAICNTFIIARCIGAPHETECSDDIIKVDI